MTITRIKSSGLSSNIAIGNLSVTGSANIGVVYATEFYYANGNPFSSQVGFTGSAGAGFTGSAGATGFTGSRGIDGIIGVDGYTGSVGFTGSAGTGFTGSEGSGFTGSAGVTGFTGSQGIQGVIGYTGSAGTGGGGGGGGYYYSSTPPGSPLPGDRWLDTTIGVLFTWVEDGDTGQWVETTSTGFLGQTGYTGSTGNTGFTGSIGTLSYTNSLQYFVGNGTQTSFTLSSAPRDKNNTTIVIDGAVQLKNTYSLSGSTIIFSEAPPTNSNIEVTVQIFGPAFFPYLTRTYVADGTSSNYTVSNGTTVDSIIVSLNGVVQTPTVDYSITGSTLTFVTAPSNNDDIVIRELPGLLQGDTGFTGSIGSAGFTGSIGIGFTGSSAPGFTGSRGFVGGVEFDVTNNGSTDYTINGSTNPTLTLARGYTYYFNVNAVGYPFYIKTAPTIDAANGYNTGVTNNATENGVITFKVPFSAPNLLYYASTTGSNMVGNIIVFDAGFGYTGSQGIPGQAAAIGYTGSQGFSGSRGFTGSSSSSFVIAVSDETTALTTGANKLVFRAPFAMTLTSIPRASLTTASTSGLVTVDINENGVSILGTNKLSIDANEKTSTTAAIPTTLIDTAIADDAEISIDIDAAGTGAAGLKVTLYYNL